MRSCRRLLLFRVREKDVVSRVGNRGRSGDESVGTVVSTVIGKLDRVVNPPVHSRVRGFAVICNNQFSNKPGTAQVGAISKAQK